MINSHNMVGYHFWEQSNRISFLEEENKQVTLKKCPEAHYFLPSLAIKRKIVEINVSFWVSDYSVVTPNHPFLMLNEPLQSVIKNVSSQFVM